MRNGQAYQQKMEKFSVSEEKKFGKIDSWRHNPLEEILLSLKKAKQVTIPWWCGTLILVLRYNQVWIKVIQQLGI